jgi:hypothetical protein
MAMEAHSGSCMQTIPENILDQFNAFLKQQKIPVTAHNDYRKWLRYFLDFRAKYSPPDSRSDQVRLFIEKLRSKKQTAAHLEQAADAVSLFFALQKRLKSISSTTAGQTTPAASSTQGVQHTNPPVKPDGNNMVCEPPVCSTPSAPRTKGGKRFDEWRCLRKTASPAWDQIIAKLADEIKLRHYSRKTLKHYADWSRKFQSYLKHKAPEELSPADVKAYLTYLAVNCKVSSSHQNLAFNALLFLFRHVLKTDFGIHKDIPRAKKSNYIPVVLSRQEIDAVLKHLAHPYKLVAQLQYGCGLRIS